MDTKTARIRALNDQLRQHLTGGMAVITPGIAALGPEAVERIVKTIAVFDDFYDRAEMIADAVVHAIGVCLGLIGVTMVMIAVNIERFEIAPITVYVIGLVTMLALSAAYNMWSVSPAKWVLRRFDHSAIYLLIAGTYTPFLAQMKNVLASAGLGSRALAYLQLVSRTCR